MVSDILVSLGSYGVYNLWYSLIIIFICFFSLLDTFKFKRRFNVTRSSVLLISFVHICIGSIGTMQRRIEAIASSALVEDVIREKFINRGFVEAGYNLRLGIILFLLSSSLLLIINYINSRNTKDASESVCATERLLISIIDFNLIISWGMFLFCIMFYIMPGLMNVFESNKIIMVAVFSIIPTINYLFFIFNRATFGHWIFQNRLINTDYSRMPAWKLFLWQPLGMLVGAFNVIPAFFNSNGRFVNDFLLKSMMISNSKNTRDRYLITLLTLMILMATALPFSFYPYQSVLAEYRKISVGHQEGEAFIKPLRDNLFTF